MLLRLSLALAFVAAAATAQSKGELQVQLKGVQAALGTAQAALLKSEAALRRAEAERAEAVKERAALATSIARMGAAAGAAARASTVQQEEAIEKALKAAVESREVAEEIRTQTKQIDKKVDELSVKQTLLENFPALVGVMMAAITMLGTAIAGYFKLKDQLTRVETGQTEAVTQSEARSVKVLDAVAENTKLTQSVAEKVTPGRADAILDRMRKAAEPDTDTGHAQRTD